MAYRFSPSDRHTLFRARCLVPSRSEDRRSTRSAPDRPFNFPSVYIPRVRREHPPLHLQRSQRAAPCDGCEFISACRRDGHRCRAFEQWVSSGRWKPEKRTRPRSLSNGPPSLRVAGEKHHTRVCLLATTKSTLAQQEAAPAEITVDDQHENEQPAEARCVVSTIDVSQEGTSGSRSISPQNASGETQSEKSDERSTCHQLPAVTFRESQDEAARRYLVKVLSVTNGERAAAARIAGVGRTHMQALIRKHAIDVPPNLKARANHRFRR